MYRPWANLLLLMFSKYFFSVSGLPLPIYLPVCLVFRNLLSWGPGSDSRSFPGAGWAAGWETKGCLGED